MTSTSDQPLDYAPPPPLHRRRFLSRIGIVALVVILAAAGVHQAPGLWHKVSLYYWQQKCLSHLQPPTTVAIEFEDDRLKSSSVPAEWTNFYSTLSPPGFRSSGTVFLHERTNAQGERLLVVLDFTPSESNPSRRQEHFMFTSRAFEPGTPLQTARLLFDMSERPREMRDAVKIFAGQPDPNDLAHFTFDVQMQDGTIRTFDGWLKGHYTSLEIRPITPPAPASAGQPR